MKFPVLKKLVIDGEEVVDHFVAKTRDEIKHLIASGHLGEAVDGDDGKKAASKSAAKATPDTAPAPADDTQQPG